MTKRNGMPTEEQMTASLIDALKVTRDELRKEVERWKGIAARWVLIAALAFATGCIATAIFGGWG